MSAAPADIEAFGHLKCQSLPTWLQAPLLSSAHDLPRSIPSPLSRFLQFILNVWPSFQFLPLLLFKYNCSGGISWPLHQLKLMHKSLFWPLLCLNFNAAGAMSAILLVSFYNVTKSTGPKPMWGFWRSFSLNVEFKVNISIIFVSKTRQKLKLHYFKSVSAFLFLALETLTQIRLSSAWKFPAWDPETSSQSGHITRLCSSALRCANAALAVFDPQLLCNMKQ